MSHTELVAWSGLVIGLAFGATAQASGFCLLRGLNHSWTAGDSRKLRAFALAMAVALLGSQGLAAFGVVSLGGALYLPPSASWLAVPLGGVLFGYGMTLANGCGARALVLLGGGNLRSFVVLVCLGLAAAMTLSGLPAWLPALVLGGALTAWALSSRYFRASPREWLGGLAIGALVPAGWLATGVLGVDDFEPVRLATLTFIAPIADGLQYAMLSTGTRLGFGVSVVAGVLAGALVMALVRRDFAWQGFSGPGHMGRSMAGAALTGIAAGAWLGIKGPLALSNPTTT